MSKCESQFYINSQASLIDPASSPVVKTIAGPQGKKEFKIYDFEWYKNELNKFELFLEGELMLGSIKITREYIKVNDRLAPNNHFVGYEHFCYYS